MFRLLVCTVGFRGVRVVTGLPPCILITFVFVHSFIIKKSTPSLAHAHVTRNSHKVVAICNLNGGKGSSFYCV